MSEFTAEAIESITELVERAVTVIPFPNDKKQFLLREADGSYIVMQDDPALPLQNFKVFTLIDCLTMFNKIGDGMSGMVLIAPDKVLGLLENDSSTERCQVVLSLEQHPAFKKLMQWRAGETFNQKTLIKVLRTQFDGMIAVGVVETLKTFKVRENLEGSGNIVAGTQGMSKSLQQEVRTANGTALPEELIFSLPVYLNGDLEIQNKTVRVLLDVESSNGEPQYTLTTVHADIDFACRVSLEEIQAKAREALAGLANVCSVYLAEVK
jgi:hypothetical protein